MSGMIIVEVVDQREVEPRIDNNDLCEFVELLLLLLVLLLIYSLVITICY